MVEYDKRKRNNDAKCRTFWNNCQWIGNRVVFVVIILLKQPSIQKDTQYIVDSDFEI